MSSWIETQYLHLLEDIIEVGVEKKDRTGTGTKSIFGRQIKHKMSEGFPLLTTKKMAWKTMVTELLWFLRGDTNIKYLVDNGCHIWDGDAYKNYLNKINSEFPNALFFSKEEFINEIKNDDEFANKWGELGPIYGSQWRSWKQWHVKNYVGGNIQIDQIQNLINELKTNPDSRRLMVSAWNVGELNQMVLPPCHYGFQVYTRELNYNELKNRLNRSYKGWAAETTITIEDLQQKCIERGLPTRAISLMWNQRSVDTFLGLPFNIASYALLLKIIAKEVNMMADELIGNLGDCHLYLNHIEQAKEQLTRNPYELPELLIQGDEPSIIENPQYWKPEDFKILKYNSWNSIKAPLSN